MFWEMLPQSSDFNFSWNILRPGNTEPAFLYGVNSLELISLVHVTVSWK